MRYIRKDLKNLKPYVPVIPDYEYKMDANEGQNYLLKEILNDELLEDLAMINLYPDNNAKSLKEAISSYINVPTSQIQVGNGSNELVEMLFKTFLDPGDKVVSYEPTFSMYPYFVKVHRGDYKPLVDMTFEFPVNKLIEKITEEQPKIVMVCNPNNPTGLLISREDVIKVIESTNSLVIVDEAYMDFSTESVVDLIDSYNNLLVLRTVSKALGMAGIRLGYVLGCQTLIDDVNRVRSPYNLNSVSQLIAEKALGKKELIKGYVSDIIKYRDWLYSKLKKDYEVYPTATNFVFFKHNNNKLQEIMQENGILIRKFSGTLDGYYRVSVGTMEEAEKFYKILSEVNNEK